MRQSIQHIMTAASEALRDMDYVHCEQRCLDAMALARQSQRWTAMARITLPLQEARRQRRMAAVEGAIQLGTPDGLDVEPWLSAHPASAVVMTQPCTPANARALRDQARQRGLMVEVLFAECTHDGGEKRETWTIATYHGPSVTVSVPGPKSAGKSDVDWFLDAYEALGDAAIAGADAPIGSAVRVEQLWSLIEAVEDHELLHQAFADAVRACARGAQP